MHEAVLHCISETLVYLLLHGQILEKLAADAGSPILLMLSIALRTDFRQELCGINSGDEGLPDGLDEVMTGHVVHTAIVCVSVIVCC